MKKTSRKQTRPAKEVPPIRRPWGVTALNVLLYVINFFLIAFIWARATSRDAGVLRLAISWFAAYLLTHFMVRCTKVPMRAALTVALGALLAFVLFAPK